MFHGSAVQLLFGSHSLTVPPHGTQNQATGLVPFLYETLTRTVSSVWQFGIWSKVQDQVVTGL